jgi:serine/threonine protein phosphatase PrpC
LTRDHTKVEELRRRGEIDDVEALVHREGNVITRALGGSRYESAELSPIEVDTASAPLYAEDILVLTSDGLVDAFTEAPQYHELYLQSGGQTRADIAEEIRARALTDEQIRDAILDAGTLSEANEALVELANDDAGSSPVPDTRQSRRRRRSRDTDSGQVWRCRWNVRRN